MNRVIAYATQYNSSALKEDLEFSCVQECLYIYCTCSQNSIIVHVKLLVSDKNRHAAKNLLQQVSTKSSFVSRHSHLCTNDKVRSYK